MGKNYPKTSITAVRFSNAKGSEFWRKQMKYTSLAFFQLSEPDRNYVLEKVLPLTTGKKAARFIMAERAKRTECFWSGSVLDTQGDVYIVRYRGVSIRLLYKRTVMEHQLTELCPEPDKPVIDPEDAWIYLDLVGNSARQTHAPTLARLEHLEHELDDAKAHIIAQDNLIIETERLAYSRAVADMREDNKLVLTMLEKVEQKQLKIPLWAMRYINLASRGTTVEENPALLDVAKQICHELGVAMVVAVQPNMSRRNPIFVPMTDEYINKLRRVTDNILVLYENKSEGGDNDGNSDRKSRQGKTKSRAEDGAHTAQRHGKAVRRPSKGK